ncbi:MULTISPECIES: phage protein [unclassified Vibrio]|uniref:phage protein n=1 Tax=unclassified Vibrio TaxID=2614977 RepID=UPI001EEFC7DB|nr:MULTISPECIES: phage protein [unclassified Vibrio]
MPQFSGLEMDVSIGSRDITCSKVTVSITDNSKTATSRGVPDGHLPGSVEATVTLEMDSYNFNLVIEEAKNAGSFRGMAPFDFMGYMKKAGADLSLKVEAFGCQPKITDLLDVDTSSEDGLVHKIECPVTSSDFVWINGVPYLKPEETKHISN